MQSMQGYFEFLNEALWLHSIIKRKKKQQKQTKKSLKVYPRLLTISFSAYYNMKNHSLEEKMYKNSFY